MLLKIIRCVHLYLLALLAGMSFIAVFGNVPAANTFPASVYVIYMQGIIHSYTGVAQVLIASTVLVSLLHLALIKERRSWYFALTLLTLLCVIGGVIATVGGNFPINNQIVNWSPENPPANWTQLRTEWNRSNLIRMVLAQVGLISSLLAATVDTRSILWSGYGKRVQAAV